MRSCSLWEHVDQLVYVTCLHKTLRFLHTNDLVGSKTGLGRQSIEPLDHGREQTSNELLFGDQTSELLFRRINTGILLKPGPICAEAPGSRPFVVFPRAQGLAGGAGADAAAGACACATRPSPDNSLPVSMKRGGARVPGRILAFVSSDFGFHFWSPCFAGWPLAAGAKPPFV